jgi:hypothetical protein
METETSTTTITDRDGNTYSTKRKGVNAAFVSWNWNRTARLASWTTKGQEGVSKALSLAVHTDDVEVFYL